MKYKKVMPQPFAVLANNNTQKNWDNITKIDFDALMQTPYGIKYANEYKQHVKKEMREEMQKRLDSVLNQACIQNFFGCVNAIEKTYEMMAIKSDARGWQKNHLSIKDVVAGMILHLGNKEEAEEVMGRNADEESIRIHDTYGMAFKFNSFDINKELGLEDVTPYEDESVFEDKTIWEIYELGIHHADVITRLLTTVTMFYALRERKEMTPNVINGIIKRSNEIASEIGDGKHDLGKMVDECRKYNFVIPKHFVDVSNQFIDYDMMYHNRFGFIESGGISDGSIKE